MMFYIYRAVSCNDNNPESYRGKPVSNIGGVFGYPKFYRSSPLNVIVNSGVQTSNR